MNQKNIVIGICVLLVLSAVGYFMGGYFLAGTTAPAPQGKLDINVVCEGALAYMTFPDGAAAEKFVTECKAGEHPEVIERYKAQIGLPNEAAL